tara:strand:- start:368 stop:547 length:180 start_codon:yes stop_codon:yes gene_type:complete
MDKIVFRFKTVDSRRKYWPLLTKGYDIECDECPGGYIVKKADYDYIGVFCERVTLYFGD